MLKFDGCYHGHADPCWWPRARRPHPGRSGSPGVPPPIAAQTLSVPYNDLEAVQAAVRAPGEIAALIVEPMAGNMGVVPPRPGFWRACAACATRMHS